MNLVIKIAMNGVYVYLGIGVIPEWDNECLAELYC